MSEITNNDTMYKVSIKDHFRYNNFVVYTAEIQDLTRFETYSIYFRYDTLKKIHKKLSEAK